MTFRTETNSTPGLPAAAILLVLFFADVIPACGQPNPRPLVRNEIRVGTLKEEIKAHWEGIENGLGLRDPVALRRLVEPAGRAALISRLRDFYGASRNMLSYRFAPEGPDWAIQGVGRAAEELEERLDRVLSLLPDLQMAPLPLPGNLARLPLDRRLAVMSRLLSRVRGRLNQVVGASDIVDIPLLRMIDGELRTIRIIAEQFRR